MSGAPAPEPEPDEEERRPERASGMRLDFNLSIGYSRRRPDTHGDRWEARLDSAGLILVGGVIAVIIVWLVLTHLVDLIP